MELPDPASSAMWGLPVEIDQQTASHLDVKTLITRHSTISILSDLTISGDANSVWIFQICSGDTHICK
jgi:hypothetical protein